MLSYHGRLVLVNSVFSAMPTFYMCTITLSPQVVKQIDRYRKHCLWSGGDIHKKGSCLAAQEPACRSKEEGGLGIINIQNQNKALLLKFLDKFYNHADIPWVKLTWSVLYSNTSTPPHARSLVGSFWWKDIIKFFPEFSSMATCNPNIGNTSLFWSDIQNHPCIKNLLPHLFSFARKHKCSISYFLDNEVERIFSLPLSIQAVVELEILQSILDARDWDLNTDDSWLYNWNSNRFSSKKAYGILQGTQAASPLFPWLWKAGNLGKHKFFFWLLLKDRLNTRDMLKRKNKFLEDYSCAICSLGVDETCIHLFFECPFNISCWNSIGLQWNLHLPCLDMVLQARADFNRCFFREIMITACWTIWTSRNRLIFDGVPCPVSSWKESFKYEIGLVCIKAKSSLAGSLKQWPENIP